MRVDVASAVLEPQSRNSNFAVCVSIARENLIARAFTNIRSGIVLTTLIAQNAASQRNNVRHVEKDTRKIVFTPRKKPRKEQKNPELVIALDKLILN